MTLHGGSSIQLLCFRPLFRRSCYYAYQRNRSPAGHPLPFNLCWGAVTDSWPKSDEILLPNFAVMFCFPFLVLFVVQQNFFLTLMMFFSNWRIILSRTFAVHKIRWCFELFGAGRADGIQCCYLIGWRQRHKRRWQWQALGPATNEVQKDLQIEKSVGDQWCWSVFFTGPQMLRQRPAISFAVFVTRTSLYWLMVTTKFCDTSRGANIFYATNIWRWRRQAGNFWIMSRMPWVLQKLSDGERKEGGLLWSWDTGCTLLLRTSLSTRLVQWTWILRKWRKFPPSMKCCIWAEDMNWCTSSGRSLLCLLSESTWMLRGHATRSWLVFPFVRVLSK